MHIKNFVKIDNASSVEEDDGIIRFKVPLKITDNSTQWNNTSYDIDSLRIDEYDGIVTQDHGNKIEDVIGKVINLKKTKNSIVIDAIKFAIKENPAAILAKNLLKGGFVTGFSIETMGQEPDNENVWKNHSLCGLSLVAHPNNKNAYAVVANSIQECKKNGFSKEDVTKSIYFLTKTIYNNNVIINRKEQSMENNKKIINFNPWHDEKGLFTDGPGSAFGGSLKPIGEYKLESSDGYVKAMNAASIIQGDKKNSLISFLRNGEATVGKGISGRPVTKEIRLIHKDITPEISQAVDCVANRANNMKEKEAAYSGSNKNIKNFSEQIKTLINKASKGDLLSADKEGTKEIESMATKKGSYVDSVKPLMKQIRAMDSTMKYIKENIKGGDFAKDFENGDFSKYNAFDEKTTFASGVINLNGQISKIKDNEVYVKENVGTNSSTNVEYYINSGGKQYEGGSLQFGKDGKVSIVRADVDGGYADGKAAKEAAKAILEDALKNL